MDFFFVFGNETNDINDSIRINVEEVFGIVEEISYPPVTIFVPQNQSQIYYSDSNGLIGCLDGWGAIVLQHIHKMSFDEFIKSINNNWASNANERTGCFSGLLFNKENKNLKIFSDISGVIPLYYAKINKCWVGGTSLVVLGRALSPGFDLAGVLQRLTPPDYVQFGQRTILRNVFKLMPGEMKIFNYDLGERTEFDNSLYHQNIYSNIQDQADSLWEVIKSDVEFCVAGEKIVNVGMSGGWDSRIIAGALQAQSITLRFMTYGMSEKDYEVMISKKCAKLLNAEFIFCDIYEKYFPTLKDFKENMQFGEATLITPWFSILDNFNRPEKEIILLGDMFEVLVGRNLKILTSPKSRQARFLHPSETSNVFKESNKISYTKKSAYLIKNLLITQMKQLSKVNLDYFDKVNLSTLLDELTEDLNSSIARIIAFDLPFTILNEEVFQWYTHGQSMSKQFLCLKQKFSPLAPTMGSRTLKETFSIDPISRADNKLLHALQKNPDFKKLSKIPSAAIPFFPSNAPLILKNLGWGLRSTIDRRMIHKMIVTKKYSERYRVLQSIDHVKLYRHPSALERVESWFSNGLLADDPYKALVKNRADLVDWPMVNNDIVGPASTCILLSLICQE